MVSSNDQRLVYLYQIGHPPGTFFGIFTYLSGISSLIFHNHFLSSFGKTLFVRKYLLLLLQWLIPNIKPETTTLKSVQNELILKSWEVSSSFLKWCKMACFAFDTYLHMRYLLVKHQFYVAPETAFLYKK